jgi:hypothetical protein
VAVVGIQNTAKRTRSTTLSHSATNCQTKRRDKNNEVREMRRNIKITTNTKLQSHAQIHTHTYSLSHTLQSSHIPQTIQQNKSKENEE